MFSLAPLRLVCRRTTSAPIGVLTLTLAGVVLGSGMAPAQGRPQGSGSYLVQFRPGTVDAAELASTSGVRLRHRYRHAVTGFSAEVTEAGAEALRRDPRVLGVYPDGVASICSGPVEQVWEAQLAARGQRVPTGVSRSGATESATAAINGKERIIPVDVAVIDTGIEAAHPDLRVAGGWSALSGGWRVDPNGHGTHVAGTIGAKDNRIGVVGVAPGVRLWAVRVLGKGGTGRWSDVIAGLDWVAARASRIKVANLSLGSLDEPPMLMSAIDGCVAAGVTVVAAAGNQRTDASLAVPARYESVIAVSALADRNGQAGASAGAFFVSGIGREQDEGVFSLSNYGAAVDIIAPGVSIRSTFRGNKYATMSGTSQASPHVAGAAALYLAKHRGASPAQVRQALLEAALPFAPQNDPDGIQEPQLNAAPF